MNEQITKNMPLLALRGIVLLPSMTAHFEVGRDKSIAAIRAAMKTDKLILLVTQKDIRVDNPSREDLYETATVAVIKQMMNLPNNNVRILAEGVSRAKIIEFYNGRTMLSAEATIVDTVNEEISETEKTALLREIYGLFESYSMLTPKISPDVFLEILSMTDLGQLCDYITANILLNTETKQEILDQIDAVARAKTMIRILTDEIEILKIEQSINRQVRSSMDKNQHEYYLREQLKAIYNELGEGENPAGEAEAYTQKIMKLGLSEESRAVLLKEVSRLSKMSSTSPEAGVIRTYLDTCLELPWNKHTKDSIQLEKVRKVLDKDHYGLEKVKTRIVEHLAVLQLSPEMKSQVLCLVGPPGVGKTSVAKSIARAIGRKYVRISLGGVRDEADIRGHRKTYIGSMPGRIINAFRSAGSNNPLVLLDEIDKMGNDYRGDPASAMLEVLDFEQNSSFRDHYIEIPFDISRALFITTANTMDTIPRPLLDRMEVIELSSYTDEEKLQIAKQHLLPKQMKRHGLKKSMLTVTDEALLKITQQYTREAGVRSLEREIEKICRKAAAAYVEGGAKSAVSAENLETFLGSPKIKPDPLQNGNEIGVATGLAWTSVGGETLKIEVASMEGNGKIQLTGSLGDVMKESANAAITYVRSHSDVLGVDRDFYKNRDIHIHIPEGAVPKDGPSAGITLATAILSELTQIPVCGDVAMTGEITLRGKVLPIGGLKEKTAAAAKLGVKTVIIPAENESDLDEIDQTVKSKLKFIPVTDFHQVIESALLYMPTKLPDTVDESKMLEESIALAGVQTIPALRQ